VNLYFLQNFTQKIVKEDLNIKRDRGTISSRIHEKVLEDTRGLHAEGGDQTLSGEAGRPHPCVARAPVVGSHHKFLEYSFTASKDASQPYVKSV
jgi:hypothetical protein